MKKIIFIIISCALFSCYPKINKHFNQNRYINNYRTHIVNDSLKLYISSPSDFFYPNDQKTLKKIIKKKKYKIYDEIIFYGKTTSPDYEYFLTIPKVEISKYKRNKNLLIIDTVIKNNNFRLIGHTSKAFYSENKDLKEILKTIDINNKYNKPIASIFNTVNNLKSSNKYLYALEEINKYPTTNKKDLWNKLQMQLTFSSFLGQENGIYKKYLSKLEHNFKPKKEIKTLIQKHKKSNTLNMIIKQAKKNKLIMFNENHFFPVHRLLIFDVLKKLKEIDYNYIALETLDKNQDSILNLKNSHLTLKSGFYTREQNYNKLIRKAKKLGYKFVAYENFDPKKNREEAQADNLYNKTFKKDKKAKVIVLAGIDHIIEQEIRGKKWFATIFKEKYKINPVTFSQTHLNSYRKLNQTDYSIISSKHFTHKILTGVDFHILNNKKIKPLKSNFSYKNKFKETVQVSVFYKKDCLKKYDHLKNVPYFVTTVSANKKINLPITENSLVYIYNKYGKKLDFKSLKKN